MSGRRRQTLLPPICLRSNDGASKELIAPFPRIRASSSRRRLPSSSEGRMRTPFPAVGTVLSKMRTARSVRSKACPRGENRDEVASVSPATGKCNPRSRKGCTSAWNASPRSMLMSQETGPVLVGTWPFRHRRASMIGCSMPLPVPINEAGIVGINANSPIPVACTPTAHQLVESRFEVVGAKDSRGSTRRNPMIDALRDRESPPRRAPQERVGQ